MSVIKRLYRGETHFDFVEISKTTLKVSLGLVIVSVLIMIVRPFNLSIDFTGGVIVTVPNVEDASVEDIRGDLRDVGYSDARVQISGDGFVTVQTESLPAAEQDSLVRTVASSVGAEVNDVNVSAVGPTAYAPDVYEVRGALTRLEGDEASRLRVLGHATSRER